MKIHPKFNNKVLCIGNISVDIKAWCPEDDGTEAYREGSIELVPGGVGRGMAINLKHLGLDSTIFGIVGNDIFGDFLLKGFESEKVNTSLLLRSKSSSTALFSVMASSGKSASCVYDTNILKEISLTQEVIDFIQNEEIKTIVMDSNMTEEFYKDIYALKEQNPDIFIFQNATAPDIAAKTLPYAKLINLFACNEFEAAAILGHEVSPDLESAEEFQKLGFQNFIITFGSRGVMVRVGHETWNEPPYTPYKIVDTIGAGDAFASGFLAGFLNQEGVKRCIHYGLTSAKETLLTRQTCSSLLSRELLEKTPEN